MSKVSRIIKIEEIKLRLGDTELILTPDEARMLRDKLDELMGYKAPQFYSSTTALTTEGDITTS